MAVAVTVHARDTQGNIIRLEEDLLICWNGHAFIVPAGFESDGMSTPRFLWPSISPAIDPKTIRGAIAHDWIYRMQPEGWTRKMADCMFYDLVREDGFAWLPAQKAYLGLRIFGGIAWRENAPLASCGLLSAESTNQSDRSDKSDRSDQKGGEW